MERTKTCSEFSFRFQADNTLLSHLHLDPSSSYEKESRTEETNTTTKGGGPAARIASLPRAEGRLQSARPAPQSSDSLGGGRRSAVAAAVGTHSDPARAARG